MLSLPYAADACAMFYTFIAVIDVAIFALDIVSKALPEYTKATGNLDIGMHGTIRFGKNAKQDRSRCGKREHWRVGTVGGVGCRSAQNESGQRTTHRE